ncbi:hypothetical protein Gotri_012278 [Gossypium trilobum]|uniref:Disease resistance RPP13-like protein 1 n=1 Tax=Gossypium trilobum TaxID=34281 RepID=A0A7J9DPR2_9ROSI|nr:hypothetical protein [Gossypium trilobum]
MEAIASSLVEAAVSGMFRSLSDHVSSTHFNKFARKEKILSELKKWEILLLKINACLEDAEEKQSTSCSVKLWLRDLRDIAYDAEDIIDELAYEARRRQMKEDAGPSSSTHKMMRKYMSACCVNFNPSTLKFSTKVESKIKKLTARLEAAVAIKNDLSLEENDRGRRESVTERLRTSSLVESRVYGREKDKEAILDILMNDADEGFGDIAVACIWGMPGVGKTTLAQLVYNDIKVESSFDLKIWVCVSEEFDVIRLTAIMLEAVTSASWNSKDLNLLQVSLKEKLSGKKFLLVLDDVWNENYEQWEALCKPFIAGAAGSKILVTTRNVDTASIMAPCETYHLRELADKDCLSLFTRHALGGSDFEGHPNLKTFGEEIVKKCSGLPLAAKTLGGLLRTKRNSDEWEDIMNSKIWHLPEKGNSILPALLLSYHHLPSHLKPQFVSKEICFFNNGDKLNDGVKLESFRHFSFLRHQYDVSKRFEMLSQMTSLRTLVALPIHMLPMAASSFLTNTVLQQFVPKLGCLRVLSLNGYCIDELPHRIGDLIHLRYLNLSRTSIKSLPESVGSLFNLQTLILHGCKNLTKLPRAIENLIDLCVLDLTDTDSLKEMPMQIGNLKNLKVLSKFIVQRDSGSGIKELKGLLHLRKEISIIGLENVVDTGEARDYVLKDKNKLEGLHLQWGHESFDHRNGENGLPVFNMLQPHQDIKRVRVACYGGTKFPSWLGGSSMANIVDINLSNCRNVMSLPALGRLPSLKKLSITGMNGVKRLDFEFFGYNLPSSKPFPVLEVLQFQNMLNWEYWCYPNNRPDEEDREFPNLRELMIHNCPKLYQKLPRYLPSLVKLNIKGCPNMAYSVMSLPSLLDLSIEDCNKMVPRSMVDLTSLTTLRIKRVPDLTCLPNVFEQFPGALKHLILSNCIGLTALWQKGNEQGLEPNELHCLASLEHLRIESCSELVSFPEIGFCPKLKRLQLRDFPWLKNLPCWIMKQGELTDCLIEDLEIEECPSLTSFPRGILPPTLKRLKIQECICLCSLPDGLMQADNNKNTFCLENLEIISCPSLVRFPHGRLPISLKMLKIWECLQLEPLSDRILPNNASLEYIDIWNCPTLISSPDSLNNLKCLMELIIGNCQYLKYFPEIDLSLPNLRTLNISNCANLKSLPHQILNLTSLLYLTICNCPCIVSFPKGGLPPNLLSLEIWDCEQLKEPISNWNLHTSTSLKDLSIVGGPDLVSFPDEKCLLPTTLVSIYIAKLNNLESLSIGLLNLPSLEELEVVDCPKLRSLPREGLPTTLGRLRIRNCSLLKDQCSREKGEYWPLIASIPCVEIQSTGF